MEDLMQKIGCLHNTSTPDPEAVVMRALQTSREMLADRGCTDVEAAATFSQVLQAMQQLVPVITSYGAVPSRVLFHNEERVGVRQLRAWSEQFSGETIVIVSAEGPTSFTKREAEHAHPRVQFFAYKDLQMNVTRHVLVPAHAKVDASEVKFCHATKGSWPKLYTNDRVAQYYNFQAGDLVRITRTFGVQQPVYYYRLVCHCIG